MNALVHSRAWLLLGWSMIHFLWVGTAVLVAAGLLRLLLRWATPNVRYAFAVTTLAMLVAAPALVATRLAPGSLAELETASPEASRPLLDVPYPPVRATDESHRSPLASESVAAGPLEPAMDLTAVEAMTRRAGRIGAAYLPWLWLAGCPFTAIYLLAGISGAGRLRRRARPATELALLAALDRLVAELGVRGRVAIGLTTQVVAPLVVGIARPMILLPPALLAAWSPEELELILLHELAHVRRWDNLVNLFQRTAEAVLFFHPAVWIVSRWVRLEREQCCDEIVLRHRDAPQKYAETLAALAVPGISPVHAAAAMANHQLVARIRNILNVEDRTMRFSARSALVAAGSVALLAGLLFVAGPLAADDQQTTPAASSPSPDDAKAPKSNVKEENLLVNVDLDGREVGTQRDALIVVKDTPGSQAANGQKRPWGPEQACGAPDTLQPGDFPTAWASATPDGQREWLEVDFGEQIDGVALLVYENNSPGAIDKLSVIDENGKIMVVWGVKDPTPTTAPSGVSIFPLVSSVHGVRIEVDSVNVPGWNEIDAVGLLDTKGQVHWANTAKASSTFADVMEPAQADQSRVLNLQGLRFVAGAQLAYPPQLGDVTIEQDIAHDPEIMRLRSSIQEIEQSIRFTKPEGDANQQDLTKKRIRRAELRIGLLNEEIAERVEQLRKEREAALAKFRSQATALETETRAAAQRSLSAEEEVWANAAKAQADRAQAQAQLQAAMDANRKLQDELAAVRHEHAEKWDQAKEATRQLGEKVWIENRPQYAISDLVVGRFDVRALTTAKQSLGIVANKIDRELQGLNVQAQRISDPARAEILSRAKKLRDELKEIEATIEQLDKSLVNESARVVEREDSLRPQAAAAAREDRAALERIEQLEKAVQELRRAQQGKQDPSATPAQPR